MTRVRQVKSSFFKNLLKTSFSFHRCPRASETSYKKFHKVTNSMHITRFTQLRRVLRIRNESEESSQKKNLTRSVESEEEAESEYSDDAEFLDTSKSNIEAIFTISTKTIVVSFLFKFKPSKSDFKWNRFKIFFEL